MYPVVYYYNQHSQPIRSYQEWKNAFLNYEKSYHWKIGRSAERLAHFWHRGIPEEIINFFKENKINIKQFYKGYIEYETRLFDGKNGRVHDLCFPKVKMNQKDITLCIEGKVDEPFGDTVEEVYHNALDRLKRNPNSKGISRIKKLYELLTNQRFNKDTPLWKQFKVLRYQLITGYVGTLLETQKQSLDTGVFLIQVFNTNHPDKTKHQRNMHDLNQFMMYIGYSPLKEKNLIKTKLKQESNIDIYVGYIQN